MEFFTAALLVKRRGLLERAAAAVQLEVRDRAGQDPHARVLLSDRFERRQKAGLLYDIAGVARPSFCERAATEHADAAGAVHGCDLPDAALAAICKGVLHMMAEGAVVHDMIQFDDAVVDGPEAPALLVGRKIISDRRDHVVVNRQTIEGRRRAIEQVVQVRRRVACVLRNWHVADGRVRPRDQLIGDGELTTALPDACEPRKILLARGMRVRELLLDVGPAAMHVRLVREFRRSCRERLSCLVQQGVDGRLIPMPSPEEEAQQFATGARRL
jgi:hypothetical protein